MAVSTSRFAALMEQKTLDLSKLAFEREKPMWAKFYKTKRPRGNESFIRLRELEPTGYATKMGEFGSPNEDQPIMGPPKEIRAERYGLLMRFSADWVEDKRTDIVFDLGESLGFSLFHTMEELAHLPFNDGFTANSENTNVAADGLVYFTQSHTIPGGGTYDTEASSTKALTWQNLIDEIIAVRTGHKTGRGHELPLMTGRIILLCGHENAQKAYEITQPSRKPDTADYTRNFVDTLKIDAIIDPFIDGKKWFVIDAMHNPFYSVPKKPPTITRDKTFSTDGGRIKGVFRHAWGAAFLRGTRGSVGE